MPIFNNYNFKNVHENIEFSVERLYEIWNRRPDGTQPSDLIERWLCGINAIKAALKEAEQNNKRVRAFGGKWSLSDVQKTSDYLINTNALNIIDVGVRSSYISNPSINPDHLVLSQCGASVMELNRELRQSGLTFSTTGASDGQSIIGAISTGTHGSAINFGSMPEMVVGMHLIVSNTLHYWIEGNTPIVNQTFIDKLMPGAQRINDDNVLNSAIVSFGSFGIIHAVMLQAEPIFELECYQKYIKWNDIKPTINGPSLTPLANFNLPTQNIHHFSILINPYDLDNTVVSVMKKVPYSGHTGASNDPAFGPSKDVLHIIGTLNASAPKITPAIMKAIKKLILGSYPEYTAQTEIPAQIFTGGISAGNGKALSVELGVDASQVGDALVQIFQAVQDEPYAGLIALRYVKKTKATLGFTKFSTSCAIEFPATFSSQTNKFYNRMYQLLEASGINFTFHWGQCNNLNSVNIIQKYGQTAVNNWLKARYTVLPTNGLQMRYTNDFLTRTGLDKISNSDPFIV